MKVSHSKAVHCFFDVYMGWNHESLMNLLKEKTKKSQLGKGEVAVFLNKSCTACKILVSGGSTYLYHRSRSPIPTEALRHLPSVLGGGSLIFGGNMQEALRKHFDQKFGKDFAERFKVVKGA